MRTKTYYPEGFVINNGSEITFGLHEEGTLQGEEITAIWFDEVTEYEQKKFYQLISSTSFN